MSKKYYVDKNYVLGNIAYKGKTVKEVVKALGCSRAYFYVAINRSYSRTDSSFIKKLIDLLKLNAALVWRDE